MKICVYAICKNEEKFVERWLESMKEADYICVLDTGSTDKTVELLKKNPKVILKKKIISPWRFDVARNESMKLIPKDSDLCLCIDLDEFFDKGWRKILEENVSPMTQQVRYRYVWNFNDDGSEGVVFFADKIHTLQNFCWKFPVHEVITFTGSGQPNVVTIEKLCLKHKADNTKSRGQYLPLLELAVKENPNNDRCLHYLAREYFFHKDYQKSIDCFEKHLVLPTSTWAEERCASQRYIAKCYWCMKNFEKAEHYFRLAILQSPKSREPYFEIGKLYFEQNQFEKAAAAFEAMQNIQMRELNYISDPNCWDGSVYDYLSVCYFYLKDKTNALKNGVLAVKYFKNDQRVLKNFELIQNM